MFDPRSGATPSQQQLLVLTTGVQGVAKALSSPGVAAMLAARGAADAFSTLAVFVLSSIDAGCLSPGMTGAPHAGPTLPKLLSWAQAGLEAKAENPVGSSLG